MSAIEILQEKLLGNFYSLFRVGYTYGLDFDSFWLIANNVTCSDEEKLTEQLLAIYQPTGEAVDKEHVAKSIILASTLQKSITSVALLPDSSLELIFENGESYYFQPTLKLLIGTGHLMKAAKILTMAVLYVLLHQGMFSGNC